MSGGVFILNGVARYSGDGYARSAKIKNNGGDVVFSKGFINASSVGLSTPLAFYQTSGTLTLGGDVDAGKGDGEVNVSIMAGLGTLMKVS